MNRSPVQPWARRNHFWAGFISPKEPRRRGWRVAATAGLVLLIGLLDFLTGIRLSLLVFYFIPVCLAVTALGWRFGVGTAVASVAVWILGDWAAGARFGSPLVLLWNALIALGTYLIVVWLLANLLALQREMEDRVRDRTLALTEEIAERERLERAVLEASERERRVIGRDLHDGLGQHLTGTALIAQALGTRLADRGEEDAAEVRKIIALVEQGIEQTRSLAKGLLLAEIEPEGLVTALEEFAADSARNFRVRCRLIFEGPVDPPEGEAATQLFRIAQEAVRNAARHGLARNIEIGLAREDGRLALRIDDDGTGFQPAAGTPGLGLRIMAHRAALIGADFSVMPRPEGGTRVECRLPSAKQSP